MELFKIECGTKKYYESRESFEKWWLTYHHGRYVYITVIAYELDFVNRSWKEIKRRNAVI